MKKFNQEMSAFFNKLYAEDGRILVYGEGKKGAPIMLIGEAPGEQETLAGRPFVGKAGKNLDRFLELTGFDRAQLYISNAVKFRPTKKSDAGRLVNRAPTREEVALFLPWLKKEIELVDPGCVVTLGNTSLKALLGPKAAIAEHHGRFVRFDGRVLFPIYHPAALIYNRSLGEVYERDLRLLADWRAAQKIPG